LFAGLDDGEWTVVHVEGGISGTHSQRLDRVLVRGNVGVPALAQVNKHVPAFCVADDARVDGCAADAGAEGLDTCALLVLVLGSSEYQEFVVSKCETLGWTRNLLGCDGEVARLSQDQTLAFLALELAGEHEAGALVAAPVLACLVEDLVG